MMDCPHCETPGYHPGSPCCLGAENDRLRAAAARVVEKHDPDSIYPYNEQEAAIRDLRIALYGDDAERPLPGGRLDHRLGQ